jgi:hypothetical protein
MSTLPSSSRKPATTTLKQGSWFVENYVNERVEVTDIKPKQNVYLHKCDSCEIVVTGVDGGVVKSITLDNCTGSQLRFSGVLSVLEVINSKRCKVFLHATVPVVQVDKSHGIELELDAERAADPPLFFTSVSTGVIVSWPVEGRETREEQSIPEQFETVLRDGSLVTEPVRHHG